MLIDQVNQHEYTPLNNIAPDQAKIEIYNSLLSEAGVLGFEYGYSLADPHTLVLWEAQFGDFANGAQVIIDQFLASGETKWLRMSGLVLLLPHGYEGQGPEHSSARIERYLQLCAERNMYVCNLTTPANYFHALRRQLHRNFRKPLIVFEPKSLLRHKLAVSSLADMAEGSRFQHVIPEIDEIAPPDEVRRIVICSGKVYYDLLSERRAKDIKDIAIIRLEQIYPFPAKTLERVLDAVSQRRCRLVPGRAGEHGRLDLRRPAALRRSCAAWTSRSIGPAMSGGSRRPARRPDSRVPIWPNKPAWWPRCSASARPGPPFISGPCRPWRAIAVATEIVVPALGESVTTATVARWIKQQGEAVAADEPLVELETDKVTVEVNAPAAGVLASIGVPEGTEVEVGAVLGLVDGAAAAPAAKPAAPAPVAEPPAPAPAAAPPPAALSADLPVAAPAADARPAANPPAGVNPPPRPLGPVSRPASAPAATQAAAAAHAPLPAAAKLIEENRLTAADIGEGAGKDGRITKGDVLAFLNRPAPPPACPGGESPTHRGTARTARQDDPPAPHHRAPAQGSAEQRRDADHLQRGGHERGDGAAQRIPRRRSRRSTAASAWAS